MSIAIMMSILQNNRYHYICGIGDIDLPAIYNNETSLTCLFDVNLVS